MTMNDDGCKHIHLTKVANMNPNTYICDQCRELFDIDLAASPYQRPKPVFGVLKELRNE